LTLTACLERCELFLPARGRTRRGRCTCTCPRTCCVSRECPTNSRNHGRWRGRRSWTRGPPVSRGTSQFQGLESGPPGPRTL